VEQLGWNSGRTCGASDCFSGRPKETDAALPRTPPVDPRVRGALIAPIGPCHLTNAQMHIAVRAMRGLDLARLSSAPPATMATTTITKTAAATAKAAPVVTDIKYVPGQGFKKVARDPDYKKPGLNWCVAVPLATDCASGWAY